MFLVLLFLTSSLVFLGFLPYCARLLPGWSERFMAAAVLATVDVIIVETGLGLAGHLTAAATIGAAILVSMVFLIVSLIRVRKLPAPQPRQSRARESFTPAAVICFLSLAFTYAMVSLVACISPSISWDSLTYHLPAVFAWASERKLFVPQFRGEPMWYPMNSELLMLWTFFAGGMKAINLWQIPYSLLGGLASYDMARRLGAGRSSYLALIAFSAAPIVLIQSLTQYNDIVFACFFLVSLSFLTGFLSNGSKKYAILFAITFGLFLGTKAMALYSWIPLGLFLVAGLVWRKELARPFAKLVPVIVVVAAVSGGFFYLRNLVSTGNIVFPVTVKLFGKTVFPGFIETISGKHQELWFVKRPLDWLFYPIFESVHEKAIYSQENGFGIQFLLGLISIPFAAFVSLRRRNTLLSTILLTIIPVSILVWLTIHPYRSPRFMVSLCGITAISLACLASAMTGAVRKTLVSILILAVLFSEFTALTQLVPREKEVLSRFFREKPFTRYEYYKAEFGDLAEGWKWIDEHTNDGELVAITYCEFMSPLFGESGMKRVAYFPAINSPFPNLRSAESPEEWPKLLFDNGVKYLFVWEPSYAEGSQVEKTIALDRPAVFKKEMSWEKTASGSLSIFSVGKPEPGASRPGVAGASETEELWVPVQTGSGTISVARDSVTASWEIRYGFGSQSVGGYAEIARIFTQKDLSQFSTITFEMDRDNSRDLLQVNLKGNSVTEQQRHSIMLSQLGSGWNTVTLNLAKPSYETKRFSLHNVASMSFVFVQSADRPKGDTTIRFRNLVFK